MRYYTIYSKAHSGFVWLAPSVFRYWSHIQTALAALLCNVQPTVCLVFANASVFFCDLTRFLFSVTFFSDTTHSSFHSSCCWRGFLYLLLIFRLRRVDFSKNVCCYAAGNWLGLIVLSLLMIINRCARLEVDVWNHRKRNARIYFDLVTARILSVKKNLLSTCRIPLLTVLVFRDIA